MSAGFAPRPRFCGQCGSQILENASFCEGCGTPVVADAPSVPVDASAIGRDPSVVRDPSSSFAQLKDLFYQAQAVPPAQLEDWLRQACAGNTDLLQQLRAMLAEQKKVADQSVEAIASTIGATPESRDTQPSQLVGPYRVLRELGRGGMGVVYLAMRDDGAFRKNVALKLLLRHLVSPEFVSRFKQERQVLAALDHTNIARILDGGDSADGMPYYVMEYVEGMPIDRYCDHHRLSLADRIRVFQQVCQAVHYLHLNLILHRDLKPSNVLVNGEGAVKLLDFGIAKFVGAAMASSQELTGVDARPMTPAYASPEQIDGGTLQKTSDIYSLGVILYRLLTGRMPYEDIDDKIAKLASRRDPPPPSANIREDLKVADDTTTKLRRAMSGEIDSIVLMALRYNPKDRYQSASDLSHDLQHFLDGDAVTAHHSSAFGRSAKFLRRKRLVIAVTIAFLLLAAFGAWQWERVQIQRAETVAHEKQLQEMLDRLEKAPEVGTVTVASQQVKELKSAFAKKFLELIARDPQPSAERDVLLDRGVRYLDRVRTLAPANPDLGRQIADSYRELAVLQRSAPRLDGKTKAVELSAYQKGAAVLAGVCSADPTNDAARRELTVLNQHIQQLGGGAVEAMAQHLKPAEPLPESQAPPPPPKTVDVKPEPIAPPPPPPVDPEPLPPPKPAISDAERADLEDRIEGVSAKIDSAERNIAPVRESLQSRGQSLNSDTTSYMSLMHSALERAKRDLAAGNANGARENAAAADGLATKVLRTIGR